MHGPGQRDQTMKGCVRRRSDESLRKEDVRAAFFLGFRRVPKYYVCATTRHTHFALWA